MSVENSVTLTLDKYDELRTIQERVQRIVSSIQPTVSTYNKTMRLSVNFDRAVFRDLIEESVQSRAAIDEIDLSEFDKYDDDWISSYAVYERPMTNEERIANDIEPIEPIKDEDE